MFSDDLAFLAAHGLRRMHRINAYEPLSLQTIEFATLPSLISRL